MNEPFVQILFLFQNQVALLLMLKVFFSSELKEYKTESAHKRDKWEWKRKKKSLKCIRGVTVFKEGDRKKKREGTKKRHTKKILQENTHKMMIIMNYSWQEIIRINASISKQCHQLWSYNHWCYHTSKSGIIWNKRKKNMCTQKVYWRWNWKKRAAILWQAEYCSTKWTYGVWYKFQKIK